MSCCALVPVKDLSQCKQRLAAVLDPGERRRLMRLMLEDVVDALSLSPAVDAVAVVSPERHCLARNDIVRLADPGGGLNAAITEAAARLRERGFTEMLVLHADLPLVGADEITQMVATGRQTGIALAADRAGQGTNAVFLRLDLPFSFHFGVRSLGRHRSEAARCGIVPAMVSLPGLHFDVDTPGDIEDLLDRQHRRYEFLQDVLRSIE